MEPSDTLDDERVSLKPAESPTRRLRWLRAFASAALVCALLAAFAGVALWRQGSGVTLATLTWQTYHDPLGLFSVRLPPGWTASVMMGSFGEGDRSGSESGPDETITFSDPALGAASASFSVYAHPITNLALAPTFECGIVTPANKTFNGYTAEGDDATTRFNSAGASFQIFEDIPGVLMLAGFSVHLHPPFPPTPTPLPASTVASDRALLNDALASFRPTDPHPLNCH